MNRPGQAKRLQSPPKYGFVAVLVISVCLGLSVPGGASLRSDADDRAREGMATIDSLLQIPDPQAAARTAAQLWQQMGDNPIYGWQLEGRLGVALMLADEPEAALPHLESVIRQQPREASHHRNLGAVLLQLNRRGRALSEYATAVELDPGNAALRQEHGQVLLSFRDTKGAAKELHLARELCGGCPEIDQPLASLYLMQKDFYRAVPALRRLHLRAPTTETRRILVAAMAQANQDSQLVAFIAALPASGRSTTEWRLLVEGEGRLGLAAHSLGAVKALRADSGPVPVAAEAKFWGQVALNLLAAENFTDGLRSVDQAIALAPDNVVYRNNRVVLLTRMGRDTEAREEWARVLELDPSLESTATKDQP